MEVTLWRWEQTLRMETVHALNERVVQLARQAGVTKDRKLQMSSTCVQTTIHHLPDGGLLVESVRVLSRFVQRAKRLVQDCIKNVQAACRSRLRSARWTAQTLHRQLRRTGEEKEAQQKALHQKLIETTGQMVRQSQQVIAALDEQTDQQAKRLLKEVLPLVEGVIDQTRTRVLEGKKMASGKKVHEGLRAAHARYSSTQRRCAGRVWSPRRAG